MDNINITRRDVLTKATTASLGALTVGTAAATAVSADRHIVGTSTPAATKAAQRKADSIHRVLDFGEIGHAVAGQFSSEALEALDKNPHVRYIEVDGTMHATGQTLPWGVDRIDAEVAHANGETSGDNTDGEGGADIAIIDTGSDSDHPDLDVNLGTGKAFVECEPLSSRPGGCGFGVKTNDNPCHKPWDDDNDHGSHVSGTADADDDSSDVVGVSTEATLHAVKVLDACGSGSYSDVAAGIEWVADQGYDVANMSLGGDKSSTVEDAVEYAYGKGVLLVAAAGNDGPCTDCVSYPAAEPEVIAVSATTKDDQLADFSSTGSEIELAAPGKDVLSTVPPESDNDGLARFDGTSMASPHVAGAGGQLMDNGYTNTEARDQLGSVAEDIGLASNEQGNGLVDVAAALGLDSSDNLGSGSTAPTVDSLSLTEVETSDSDAEFDADWQVSDADGDLDTVDLTLYELDSDGNRVETEDSAQTDVSGDSASGTTRLVAAGDDGSGNTYEVELTVTDSNGNTASDTATAIESEDTTSGTAPTIDSLSLSEDNHGGSPHADFDASWRVSDSDGDLDTVEVTLYELDSNGNRVETEDVASVDVSGSDAAGTTDLKAKFDETNGKTYEVELVVTDANGNTASETATEVEDGS